MVSWCPRCGSPMGYESEDVLVWTWSGYEEKREYFRVCERCGYREATLEFEPDYYRTDWDDDWFYQSYGAPLEPDGSELEKDESVEDDWHLEDVDDDEDPDDDYWY